MKPFYPTRRTIYRRVFGLVLFLLVSVLGFAQPANDICGNATNLTSVITCGGTNGSMRNGANPATSTAGINAFCGNAGSPDVWYTFTAQSQFPTITISGLGTNLQAAPRLQLFTNASCTGATLNTNSLGCVGANAVTSLSLNVATVVGGVGLTIGTVYKIRVYINGTSVAAGIPATWNFTICVQDPVPPVPSNDECLGAVTIPVGGGCSNTLGTIEGATLSSGVPAPGGGCGTPTYDVWYKFIATTTNPSINLSGAANNFTNRRVQLLRGSCGAYINVGCTTTFPWSPGGITVGTTYYIRVYSTTASPAPAVLGDFNICVSTTNMPPRYGNGYINLSKRLNGGVVQQGDTLEIRFTVNHTSGTLFQARYVDNVPTNTTMLSAAADSLRVITNEGLTFRRYTPTTTADAGLYQATPPVGNYNLKVNLGFGFGAPGVTIPTTATNTSETDATGAANIINSDDPRGGGGVLFAVAYRVRVTGNPGDTITFGAGKFIYRATSGGADIQLPAVQYKIIISNPLTLCTNSVGLNSAGEVGGTFGAGTLPNRATDLDNPIAGYTFVGMGQGINDGMYSVVKNVSPTNSTNPFAQKQNNCVSPPAGFECANRMHNGYWDITGDHTGTNNAAGNPPPGPGANAGYMLIVNADWVASEAFRQRLTGLCPSTYYEFSAWIKNVCTPCGADSTGAQTYRPGVYPNLTFALDGFDRYSTGQVDTLGWLKKGFVFITGDTQTTVTFTIRNNSQGGGGNDWALDDIGVATCMPNMAYSPSANPTVCRLNARTIYDTVRSHFNNYVYYIWQRSTNGGTIWNDIGVPQGPASPVFNNATQSYEYLTHFVVPPWWTDVANNGDLYRVVAATTIANITSSDCIFTNAIPFLTMNVLNCGTPLKTDLLSFTGKLVGDYGNLSWTTSTEEEPVKYQIERSTDGSNFTLAGTVNSRNSGAEENNYTFTDPVAVSGKVYYRLAIAKDEFSKKYSRIITLSKNNENNFELRAVVNPFGQSVNFDISAPGDMKIEAEILNMTGAVVKRKTYMVRAGVNMLSMPDTGSLPAGSYIFRVKNNNQVFTKKIVKGTNL